jgi:pantoate--beta-alanine ligase
MIIAHTLSELHSALGASSKRVFVPTMGNLHAGHLQLIHHAKALCQHPNELTVASIFVNRLQFAPHEDFDQYPRTFDNDCDLLRSTGCDVVFAPDETLMYPQAQTFTVHPPKELADLWEGHFRPGFFTGVCTVVMKLFHMVSPSTAIFGKKDFQQWKVLEQMVRQLAMPIEILGCPIERSKDGLALSSRNGYLSEPHKLQALALQGQLRAVAQFVKAQERGFKAQSKLGMDALNANGWRVDYLAVCQQSDLQEVDLWGAEDLVILAAATLGSTRLIDNIEVQVSERTRAP